MRRSERNDCRRQLERTGRRDNCLSINEPCITIPQLREHVVPFSNFETYSIITIHYRIFHYTQSYVTDVIFNRGTVLLSFFFRTNVSVIPRAHTATLNTSDNSHQVWKKRNRHDRDREAKKKHMERTHTSTRTLSN